MTIFLVFIISILFIVALFIYKGWEISTDRKTFLNKIFFRSDLYLLKMSLKIKLWWGHINFKNLKKILSWFIINTHKLLVSIKRRFDHKQSHFFTKTKKDHDILNNKETTSFFLKDVADYKKNLRENVGKGDDK